MKAATVSHLQRVGTHVGKLEHKVKHLDAEVMSNKAKIWYNNIKIGGLTETDDEDPMSVVESFLDDVLNIQITYGDVLEASRMKGSLRRKVAGQVINMPWLMYVRCTPSLRKIIEDAKHLLKNKKDPTTKIKYSIKSHLPASHYAAQIKYNSYIKQILHDNKNRAENEKWIFYFHDADLYVNSNKYVELVAVLTMEEILNILPITKMWLATLQFIKTEQKSEKESTFQAFALPVNNAALIQDAYLQMKLQHPTAAHVMLGYRVEIESEIIFSGQSDYEHQGDAKIMEALFQESMLNLAVFVVRWYKGVHIGGSRLTIIHNLAKQACLKFPVLKQKSTQPVPSGSVDRNNESDDDTAEGEDDACTEPADSGSENASEEASEEEVVAIPPKKQRVKKLSQGGRTGGSSRGHGRGSRQT